MCPIDSEPPREILYCLDPGTVGFGAAVFLDGELRAADVLHGPGGEGPETWAACAKIFRQFALPWAAVSGARRFSLAVEGMQVYGRDGAKYASGLLQLMAMAGAVAQVVAGLSDAVHATDPGGSRFSGVQYLPGQWTRRQAQEPRDAKILRRLLAGTELEARFAEELEKIPPSYRSHAMDAVGIGLYHLRRM